MYHNLFIDIPHGEKSIAFCSYKQPKKLVIFVHGFNGSAQSTWDDLPEIIQTQNSFSDADVIFYGYESLKSQANNMSISLFNLIDAATNISNMPYPDRGLSNGYCYDTITIVAHSLGAVVSRLALLYAYDSEVTWLDKCKLVLYAPAHWGSRLPQSFKECFTGSFKFIQAFAYTKYPILIDLEEDSKLLTELLENCKKIIATGKGDFLKAAKVVWAEYEKVVISKRFLEDSLQKQINKSTHVSVCKVNNSFTEPLTHLITVL